MDDMTGRPDFQYNMGALRVEIRLHDVDTEAPAATQLDLRAFLDYLQPNSETPMSAMVSSLLQAIPEQDSDQKEATLMRLSNFCIHAAQRIHYAHPSQLKLARLLQQVAQSPKTVTDVSVCPCSRREVSDFGSWLIYHLGSPSWHSRTVSP